MRFMNLAAFVVMGALLAACSKEDVVEQAPEIHKDNIVTFTTAVGMDPSTRALTEAGVKTFAVGDQVAVCYENESSVVVKAESAPLTIDDIYNEGKSAIFSFSLTNPKQGSCPASFYYPASIVDDGGELVSIAAQDGTFASIADNYDLASYSDNLTISGTNVVFPSYITLANALAICKFTIKQSGVAAPITNTITRLTIAVPAFSSDVEAYGYTITRTPAEGPIYAAIKAVASKQYIYLYATDGIHFYQKTVSGKTLAKGNMYPITVTMEPCEPALPGEFTVSSSGQKVQFSRGNLQYMASTNTWRFAENQWSRVGSAGDASSNVSIGYDACNNMAASSDYSGWIDLFGWGTSGHPHGAVAYQPWSFNTSSADYYAYGTSYANLYDNDGSADWGANFIANGGTGWQTLKGGSTISSHEWCYLLFGRSDTYRFVKAVVHNVKGLVIFPDGFAPSFIINDPNTRNGSYNTNSFTDDRWSALEAAGCVFLPAAGYRALDNSGVSWAMWESMQSGHYWVSSSQSGNQVRILSFTDNRINPYQEGNTSGYTDVDKYLGCSVRLVRYIPPQSGSVSLGHYNNDDLVRNW